MKKILLSLCLFICGLAAMAQTTVLYYNDGVAGTDNMANALAASGFTVTTATSESDFQTLISTPANYDMAIYFVQSNYPDGPTATALANFVNLGKLGMYCDWSMDVTLGAMFGVDFTGNDNMNTVNVTDPALAAGLTTNPFTLSNPGWGTYSYGLIPLAGGTTSAVFTPSGETAIARTMGGKMLVFGFLGDTSPTAEIYTESLDLLTAAPGISTTAMTGAFCAGATVTVGFTASGSFNAPNIFTAELSDASGSFAAPVSIGTLSSTASGTISATIPAATPAGTGYRIRVTANDPSVTGTDNGSNLTINVPVASSQAVTLCSGESVTVGSSTYSTAGTYMDVLTAANSCDSTVTTTVNVNAAIATSQSVTLCPGASVTVGSSTYSTAGTFTDVLTAANSCDSTVTTTVNVNTLDLTTSTTGVTITATTATAAYRWIDCTSNTIIVGEMSQSFTAFGNGSYAVEITENGCTDTSACVLISSVGVSEANSFSATIYPNPAKDELNVALINAAVTSVSMTISDVQGKIVFSTTESNVSGSFSTRINTSNLSKGLYFLNLNTDAGSKVYKLIIE